MGGVFFSNMFEKVKKNMSKNIVLGLNWVQVGRFGALGGGK